MSQRLRIFVVLLAVTASISAPQPACGGDLKLLIPRRSQSTPVQRLNREGVEAIRKQRFEKAEAIFYKAYLIDPDDPFTLNNLGYVAELQGQLERAQKFYALATQQASDAVIDRASARKLQGKDMREAVSSLRDVPMQINRTNVKAMQILSEGRFLEAQLLLQQALTLDPQNAFTLNNMGVAKETEGDLDAALKYYTAAENSHSSDLVIVTLDKTWRGKPLTEVAADNARKIRQRQGAVTAESKAAMLNMRGVSAVNRNDWHDASQDFLQAYSLDPNSAFSINNLGYVAEMDGDLETAEFFYEKARKAPDANSLVGLATRKSAEGMKLFAVVDDTQQKVDARIEQDDQARRRQAGPIGLKRRDDNQFVTEPAEPPAPASPQSQNSGAPPASSQPPVP